MCNAVLTGDGEQVSRLIVSQAQLALVIKAERRQLCGAMVSQVKALDAGRDVVKRGRDLAVREADRQAAAADLGHGIPDAVVPA